MEEMKALRKWWWTTLPNCLCLMAVDNPWIDNEHVGGNGVAIEKTHERPSNDDVIVEVQNVEH